MFAVDVSKRDAQELEVTILPTKRERAVVKGYLSDFCRSFDHLTMGFLEHLKEAKGIVFAGGAVVGALTDTTVGDVDIFLICPVDEATDKLRSIFEALQQIHKKNSPGHRTY